MRDRNKSQSHDPLLPKLNSWDRYGFLIPTFLKSLDLLNQSNELKGVFKRVCKQIKKDAMLMICSCTWNGQKSAACNSKYVFAFLKIAFKAR